MYSFRVSSSTYTDLNAWKLAKQDNHTDKNTKPNKLALHEPDPFFLYRTWRNQRLNFQTLNQTLRAMISLQKFRDH